VFRFPSRGANSRLTPERVFSHDAKTLSKIAARGRTPDSFTPNPLLDKLSLRVILLEMSKFNNDAIQPDRRGISPRLSKPKILAGALTPGQYDEGTPIDF
jgi:hypothetical protein